MNRYSVFTIALLLLSMFCFSQGTKPKTAAKAPVKPATPPKPVLKDLRDSASYTAGIFVVNRYREQGIRNFNSSLVSRAVNDLQTGKKPLLTMEEAEKAITAYQQQLQSNKKPVVKPAKAGVILKDTRDSASYAAGLFLHNFFTSIEITNLNSAVVGKGCNDLQTAKPRLLNDDQANNAVIAYQNKIQLEKNKPNIEAGEKFLSENKKREGVITTPSGLQYEILTAGTGPIPQKEDVVSCNYRGTYIDGTEFDNSNRAGKPVSFSVTRVITGWTEALMMMPVGSKWKLYVPYKLGYGPGKYQSIPGGSTLIFEVELVGINPK